jgi:hypothetical protein
MKWKARNPNKYFLQYNNLVYEEYKKYNNEGYIIGVSRVILEAE